LGYTFARQHIRWLGNEGAKMSNDSKLGTDREHDREMTDAELLAICGGSSAIPHVRPNITNVIMGGLGAVAGAVSTAANTIVNAL
jgi:hypothetical protein